MALTTTLLFILIPTLIGLSIYYYWTKKNNTNQIRILLFRKTGNVKEFVGVYTGIEKKLQALGYYITHKGLGLQISTPDVNDFFPSGKIRTLALCKYGTDDYRVMKVLKDQTFYAKEPQYLYETIIDEDTGEEIQIPKLDKKGDPIIDKYVETMYNEPIGITQEAQEVWRFNRDFYQRMDEYLKNKQGFWDKYGQLMINVVIIIAFMIFALYMLRQNADLTRDIMNSFGEEADNLINELESPTFAERLIENIQRKEVENKAPIS